MSKRKIRFFSLITAMVLMVNLVAGCGNNTENPDSTAGNKNPISGSESNPAHGVDPVTGVNPEDYRGTSITLVTWKDPDKNEDGIVIDNFEKEYGITVNVQLVNQHEYINTIASNIASGTQGDIFFVTSSFPACLSVMEPLDAARLNLEDPIWDQYTLEWSTIDGHPYLLNTVSNIWSEVDICVYNKALFENNGITSPAEYYEQGKWTMEAFKKCCQEISALGKDYKGASVWGDAFLGGIGAGFFKYENGEFSVNVDDRLYAGMQYLSELYSAGLLTANNQDFSNGKTGMAITNAFALKKTGHFASMNPDQIGATYLPRWDEESPQYTSSMTRAWGLIKGAKNPVAAGIFLKYYLDVNNYDLENTFMSDECESFFFQVAGDLGSERLYYYTLGMCYLTGYSWLEQDRFEYQFKDSPAQVRTNIDSKLNVMNDMANKANELMKNLKQELAEEYGTAE